MEILRLKGKIIVCKQGIPSLAGAKIISRVGELIMGVGCSEGWLKNMSLLAPVYLLTLSTKSLQEATPLGTMILHSTQILILIP